MKRKSRNRRRKDFIEDLKLTLVLILFTVVMPLGMFLHWLHFGY